MFENKTPEELADMLKNAWLECDEKQKRIDELEQELEKATSCQNYENSNRTFSFTDCTVFMTNG